MSTTTQATRKVVSLIRVSTDSQKDKSGPDVQRRDVRFTCKELGLAVADEVLLDGVTGTMVSATRQFKELRAHLSRPDIAGLVIPCIDRLTRTTEFTALAALVDPLLDTLKGRNSKRLFVDGKELDLSTSDARKILFDQAHEAERERKKIRHRTMEGRDDMRRKADASVDQRNKGVNFTRHIAKGLPGSENAGTWSFDPAVRATMREAYHRVLDGETLKSLFSELGFNSPSALRDSLASKIWIGWKCKTKTCTEHVWNEDKQKFMSRGRVELQGDERIETRIPELADDPVVTDEVWYAVQAILQQNRKTWSQIGSRSDEFLGTNLLHCSCGRKLYHKIHSRAGTHYYQCAYKAQVKGTRRGEPCNEPMVRAELIDEAIAWQAAYHFTDIYFIRHRIMESLDTTRTDAKREALNRAEAAVVTLDKKRRNIEVGGDNLGWDEERIARAKEVKAELVQARLKASTLKAELDATLSAGDVDAMIETLRSEFANFDTLDMPGKKALLQKFVEGIDISRDDKGIVIKFRVRAGVPALASGIHRIVSSGVQRGDLGMATIASVVAAECSKLQTAS